MILPPGLLENYFEPKNIYYFASDQISSNEPHYFIFVSKENGEQAILVCCTSQFEKRAKFIQSRKLPLSTLIWIKPTPENGLKKDSYIDCNKLFNFSIEDLKNKHKDGKLKHAGILSDNHYEQILIGLNDSPLIVESDKEKLPEPESKK